MKPTPAPALDFSVDTSGPIRRFLDSGLQAAVDQALATIEPDKHVAVVAVAEQERIRGIVACKLGEDWSIVGALEKPLRGKQKSLSAQAVVRWSR